MKQLFSYFFCVLKKVIKAILAFPYRLLILRLGSGAKIYPGAIFRGGSNIEIGADAWVAPLAYVAAIGTGTFKIGSNSEIHSFSRIETDRGNLSIGDHFSLNSYSCINGFGGLVIGNDVRIASHCVILSSTHSHADCRTSIRQQDVMARPTLIGNDVWIGSHSVILGGVTIGSHCIIAAGSIVTNNIPDYAIAAGVPARVVRLRNTT